MAEELAALAAECFPGAEEKFLSFFSQPITEESIAKEGLIDTIIAAHATVVAADALGYGSCYIGDIIEHCDTQREILGLPEYVKPVAMAVFGKPTQSQIDRKKPPRFALCDVVHENTYKMQDADEMIRMLKERQGLDDEAFDRWIMAFTKRKWNCDFSREMSRSAAQMIEEWREGK